MPMRDLKNWETFSLSKSSPISQKSLLSKVRGPRHRQNFDKKIQKMNFIIIIIIIINREKYSQSIIVCFAFFFFSSLIETRFFYCVWLSRYSRFRWWRATSLEMRLIRIFRFISTGWYYKCPLTPLQYRNSVVSVDSDEEDFEESFVIQF